jgi:hypothetical protein
MQVVDLTSVVQCILTVAAVAISTFIIPWIKARTTAAQQDTLKGLMDVLVQAAEQLYGSDDGQAKLATVEKWLAERGYELDRAQIEAAVLRLHSGNDVADAY